jgi:predicted Zn-dependent protease
MRSESQPRDQALVDLAERALSHVSGEGQVTLVHERSLTSRFARSAPTQATDVNDVTVHLLCLRDGQTGAAAVNSLDEAGLADAGAGALAAARAAAGAGSGDYPGLPDPASPVNHGGHDPRTALLDPAEAGAALQAAFDTAADSGLEAFGIWTAGEVTTAIASTSGVHLQEAVTDAYMKVICRDARGHSGFAADAAVASCALDPYDIAGRAAAKVSREDPVALPPGEYTVVLAPDAVGTLLDFLAGLAFNGLAHAEGRGALAGRLGTRVAHPLISLADAPGHPRTLPRSFDAEGVPKHPLPLIQDGIAHRVAHDRRSAVSSGAGPEASTGHALAPGGDPHGPRPTNLVLAGGGCSDERELMEGIKRGLYVTRLWYVNTVQDKQTLLTGVTRDGTFLIEEGELSRPARNQRFTDSVLDLLMRTEALTARTRLACEAHLYGRRFATGVVCPALRARGFRITGEAPD